MGAAAVGAALVTVVTARSPWQAVQPEVDLLTTPFTWFVAATALTV
jgi:hypothetical protein